MSVDRYCLGFFVLICAWLGLLAWFVVFNLCMAWFVVPEPSCFRVYVASVFTRSERRWINPICDTTKMIHSGVQFIFLVGSIGKPHPLPSCVQLNFDRQSGG